MYRLSLRRAAASDRIEPFLAFVPKFLRAEAVAVEGLKMEMYASMSGCGGGSLCSCFSFGPHILMDICVGTLTGEPSSSRYQACRLFTRPMSTTLCTSASFTLAVAWYV